MLYSYNVSCLLLLLGGMSFVGEQREVYGDNEIIFNSVDHSELALTPEPALTQVSKVKEEQKTDSKMVVSANVKEEPINPEGSQRMECDSADVGPEPSRSNRRATLNFQNCPLVFFSP